MRSTVIAFGIASILGTAACGGEVAAGDGSSTGSGGGPGSSGLAPGLQLQNLTQEQVVQLVTPYVEYLQSPAFLQGLCRVTALEAAAESTTDATDASLRTECAAAYASCVAEPIDPIDMSDVSTAALAGCTATVGEYETCAEASFAMLSQIIAQFPSCSQLTGATVESSAGLLEVAPPDPPECVALEQKCPSFGEPDTEPTPPQTL